MFLKQGDYVLHKHKVTATGDTIRSLPVDRPVVSARQLPCVYERDAALSPRGDAASAPSIDSNKCACLPSYQRR